MREALAKLETALKDNAPFVHAKLNPPATANELAALRAAFGGTQVQSLELWYQWHNGCSDHTIDLLPLGRMLSISESLQDRKLAQGIPFVDAKRKSALKILDDGSGDGFFLDVAAPNPRVFYHMLEDPYPCDYGSLEQFIEFILEVHTAGLASHDKNGMVDFDETRYEKIEAAYLKNLQPQP
ncbi:MAG: SMI1/KNR4 family protein [Planctomycetes bacterium]|nr:SMI1/KNR4 family protein [Planctomycetota bacterium]